MDIEMKVQILRACSSKKGNRCSSCQAFGQGNRNCIRNAMKDAVTALSTLQTENEKFRDELEQVKRDRDAAIEQLHGMCNVCQHYYPYHNRGKCAFCEHETIRDTKIPPVDNWEWRGS